jgi:hypothetical protein
MKRSAWFFALLAAGLVLMAGVRLSAGSHRKPRKSKPPAEPVAVQPAEPTDVVDGYGPSEDAAQARALENAQERVVELLRDKAGDPNWTPPADLLALSTLREYGVTVEDGKSREAPPVDGRPAWVARYKVQLTPEYLQEVQHEARQDRLGHRHLLLFRVLGGLLAVLLVTAGYLRLEEMTRGYATHLLRLGVFAVLAAVGVAIWLTL